MSQRPTDEELLKGAQSTIDMYRAMAVAQAQALLGLRGRLTEVKAENLTLSNAAALADERGEEIADKLTHIAETEGQNTWDAPPAVPVKRLLEIAAAIREGKQE